jgi:hypothetical protein
VALLAVFDLSQIMPEQGTAPLHFGLLVIKNNSNFLQIKEIKLILSCLFIHSPVPQG